jgi:uncharacterized membrane protein YhhN
VVVILAAAVTVVAVLLLLVAEHRGDRVGKWTFKPLASTGFVAFALAAGALETPYGIAVLVALVLSWWGDLLLIPKDKRAFLVGILSFLLGHLAFAAAFVVAGVSWPWVALAALVLAIPGALVGRYVVPKAPERLRKAVIAYIVVITTMVAFGVGAVAAGAHWLMLAAAFVFYLSDLCVARNRFVTEGFVNRAFGLPLYYGAQLAFGVTVWMAAGGMY